MIQRVSSHCSLFLIVAAIPASLQAGPCGEDPPVRKAYFGDLHIHTRFSADAYVFDTPGGPMEAYESAKGLWTDLAPIVPEGEPRQFRISEPLDFAAVTDHGELLGETALCTQAGTQGRDWLSDEIADDLADMGFADQAELLRTLCSDYRATANPQRNTELSQLCVTAPENTELCAVVGQYLDSVWRATIDAAEDAYEPCSFTTFAGYEWTSGTAQDGSFSRNHRNVIYRDVQSITDAHGAPLVQPLPARDATATPGALRHTLRAQCRGLPGDPENPGLPGCDVLAIPHTSNDSAGKAFQLDPNEHPKARAEMEPLIEIIQHKQSSECSPASHPDDPLCSFEVYVPDQGMPLDMASGGMARAGLNAGLIAQAQSGDVNPIQLGFIASTDTHNATAGAVEEDNYPGHAGGKDATASRRLSGPNAYFSPGGLAGVWAYDNTREGIFDALRARETFATSGPRIKVRMVARWSDDPPLPESPRNTCAELARDELRGVTFMGSTLPTMPTPTAQPQLLMVGIADPSGASLARMNLVKAWVDSAGELRETQIELPAAAEAGNRFLCRAWKDEAFEPTGPAYYYLRVLELPTPRWSKAACDAQPSPWSCEEGSDLPPPQYAACCDASVYTDIQERAWTSPIFYGPTP
ncbi:MAG: DUF3604 domain-containing protein [Pseudomonadota bacterium]